MTGEPALTGALAGEGSLSAAGPAPEGAPGGTFKVTERDWDMISKI